MPAFFQTHAVLIRDVRVFDGEQVLEDHTVLVEDGTISHVGETYPHVAHAEVIDGRGRMLLPGLFDAHLHVPTVPLPALRQLASFGVTTVLDMFGGGKKLHHLKQLEIQDAPDMADLRAAGHGAIAPESPLRRINE